MSDEFNQNPFEQNNEPQQPQNPAPSQGEQPYIPYNEYSQPPQNPYQSQQPIPPYGQPYGQPGQPPYFSPAPVQQEIPCKGLAIAGFVVSLIGLLCCGLLPPLPFLGMIFSIVAVVKGNKGGLAIAGIVLGAIGVALVLYYTISFLFVGASAPLFQEFMDNFYYTYY